MKKLFNLLALALLAVVAAAQPIRPWLNPGLSDPRNLGNLSAWYDASYTAGLIYDSASRVSLISDRSGNSGTNVLCLNAVSGNYASAPDSGPISFTSDLDAAVDVAANDYTPTGNQILVAKGTSIVAANLEYALQLNTGGTITLYWSTGAATLSATSTSAVAFSDYSRGSIRVTLDADNGAAGHTVTFYTATTFGTWSQLGTAVTTAGTTSIQNSTNALAIGSFTGGTSGLFAGRNYRTTLTGTIGGTLAFDANFATFTKLATSGTESSSNAATVTINSSGDTGARISGERDLVQLTASKQPIYLPWAGTNYGFTNALTANNFSTPDSAAVSVTGSADFRAQAQLANWASATNVFLGKWAGGALSYVFWLSSTGNIRLNISLTGAASAYSFASSASVGFAANDIRWVRATYNSGTGDCIFYTSVDGSSWTQLGTTQTSAGGAIFDSATSLLVGADNTGGGSSGRIYRAQLYNGIAGTLAFDMNPATYTGGATFTDSSANAATITINSGAVVVRRTQVYADGTDDYMKAAPWSLAQPETVEFVGSQVTWTSGDYIYDGNASNSGALIQTTGTPQVNLHAGSSVAGNTGWALKTGAALSAVYNGASSELRVNRGTATTGNAGAATMNGYTLASAGTAGSYGNITFSEAAIYSAALTSAQQFSFVNYAFVKWKL